MGNHRKITGNVVEGVTFPARETHTRQQRHVSTRGQHSMPVRPVEVEVEVEVGVDVVVCVRVCVRRRVCVCVCVCVWGGGGVSNAHGNMACP